MAGYFIYSIDGGLFSQFTTVPTRKQAILLAMFIMKDAQWYLEQVADDSLAAGWLADRDTLANEILQRLARPDWYSDLVMTDAVVWDSIIGGFIAGAKGLFETDFRCYHHENIYPECIEIAAEQGATMMAGSAFGSSSYRYFGKPAPDEEHPIYPMHSLYDPEQAKRLLAQLEAVEPHFAALPSGEGTPHQQFFEGLLPPIRDATTNNRAIMVQTDL